MGRHDLQADWNTTFYSVLCVFCYCVLTVDWDMFSTVWCATDQCFVSVGYCCFLLLVSLQSESCWMNTLYDATAACLLLPHWHWCCILLARWVLLYNQWNWTVTVASCFADGCCACSHLILSVLLQYWFVVLVGCWSDHHGWAWFAGWGGKDTA